MTLIVLVQTVAVHAAEPLRRDSPPVNSAERDGTELNNRGVEAALAGRFEEGISLLRQALQLDPTDPLARKNLSGVLTDWSVQLAQQGDVDRSITVLQEALDHDPENGYAMVRLGNLYYLEQHDLAQAIRLWRRSYSKIPADQRRMMANRIAQAERDQRIERGFANVQTAHFHIRFVGPEHAEAAKALGEGLERAYARLSKTLETAPASFTAMLYTTGDFQRIAGQRDVAVGLYDGRIRLRLEDVGTPDMRAILAHELAHAFLAELYGSRIPTWIHEGFAQVQEPSQALTERQQTMLKGLVSGTSWVPLKWLDRRFDQPSDVHDLQRAYLQSRQVVEVLIARHGVGQFRAFLKRLADGAPIDRAFDHTFTPARWSRLDHGLLD